MKYPKIVDINGNTLAILNNIINPVIKEQINGEYTFTFTAIIEELKTDYIHHSNFIEVDDNLFQISKYTKERTENNELLCSVLAEHISYKLIDEKLDNFVLENTTPQIALDILLQNTDFTTDIVNVVGTDSIILEEEVTKREVLNEIVNTFGGEFKFDRYKISLLTQRGQNNGTQFRISKNIKGIKKTVDNTQKDNEGNPKVSYEINIIELNELEEFKGLEGFGLGDTVRIIDEDLDIDIFARIIEYEYNPIQRINSRIVLSNFVENIADFNAELRKNSNLVSKRSQIWDRAEVISPNKTISTEILEGEINTLNNEIKAGLGTVHVTEANGILITDQPTVEASTKALRLLGGVLAIANEKDSNGNFIWRTFGTGDGFVADEIVSGKILTSLVKIIGNSDVPNAFYWDENGLRIHKINEDNTIDSGQYILVDNEGLHYYKNNNPVIIISFSEGGLKAIHNDGSYTKISDDGLERYIGTTGRQYFYEREIQIYGDWHHLVYNFKENEGWGQPTNEQIESDLSPEYIIQLPESFIGKNFKVFAEPYTGDSEFLKLTWYFSEFDTLSDENVLVLRIYSIEGDEWDGIDPTTMPQTIKDTGQFKVKAYIVYKGSKLDPDIYGGTYVPITLASRIKFKIDVIA